MKLEKYILGVILSVLALVGVSIGIVVLALNNTDNNNEDLKTVIEVMTDNTIETEVTEEESDTIETMIETEVTTSATIETMTTIEETTLDVTTETTVTTTEAISTKSNEEIASEVVEGKWGNGSSRRTRMLDAGYDYAEIQPIVNDYVKGRRRYSETTVTTESQVVNTTEVSTTTTETNVRRVIDTDSTSQVEVSKTNNEIASEIVAGKWGNGSSRRTRLIEAGYDYAEVQTIVNEICNGRRRGTSVSTDNTANNLVVAEVSNNTGYVVSNDYTENVTENYDITSDDSYSNSSSSISDADFILLCNCVAHEAGSNWITTFNKALVVEVVMNRVYSSSYPDTVYGVITQRGQFSGCWNYANLSDYSSKVSDDVIAAVNMYFNDPSSFNHGYTGFWGDGKQNHFR